MSRYNYSRRKTNQVAIGNTAIGGSNPIRIQSMTNTDTLDTDASAAQALAIAKAGGEIVRLTTQGVAQASAMADIRRKLDSNGCHIPIVADVHFNPAAAMTAAKLCEKVRINPGNFIDPARTFQKLEYTDEEYQAELSKLRDKLIPLLNTCRDHKTALRLGVNHGSLSDRIMSRYGDTPAGMVESAMEFLRICRSENFSNVVISIKASNTQIMVQTVRLLVETMEAENMHYPLHLGVTEAGDGEDGRIKSAVGIATLLNEGIGDTIRVSLTEAPEAEIPVAKLLRDYITSRQGHEPIREPEEIPTTISRELSQTIGSDMIIAAHADTGAIPADATEIDAATQPHLLPHSKPIILRSTHRNAPGEMMAWIDRFQALGAKNPIILSLTYPDNDPETLTVKAAADLGTMLLNGYGSGIKINTPQFSSQKEASLELAILQAARLRFSKTEYIACPGCGRTLFDLQETLQEVRKATAHLKGLKIGVMGCIVNGPGEMADADYGYVGAGRGRVSIYRRKQLIAKNIPSASALPTLIDLIKADGRWIEPAD